MLRSVVALLSLSVAHAYERPKRASFADEPGSVQHAVKAEAEAQAYAATTEQKQDALDLKVCVFSSDEELQTSMAAAYEAAMVSESTTEAKEGEEAPPPVFTAHMFDAWYRIAMNPQKLPLDAPSEAAIAATGRYLASRNGFIGAGARPVPLAYLQGPIFMRMLRAQMGECTRQVAQGRVEAEAEARRLSERLAAQAAAASAAGHQHTQDEQPYTALAGQTIGSQVNGEQGVEQLAVEQSVHDERELPPLEGVRAGEL